MKVNETFIFFKTVYPILKDVSLHHISKKKNQKYHGFMSGNFEKDEATIKGKSKETKVNAYMIELDFNIQNAQYVLMHEIAHCLAPLVERKYKDEWVVVEHDRKFYQQLWQILEIAFQKGIYFKKFDSIHHLMKYDASV